MHLRRNGVVISLGGCQSFGLVIRRAKREKRGPEQDHANSHRCRIGVRCLFLLFCQAVYIVYNGVSLNHQVAARICLDRRWG